MRSATRDIPYTDDEEFATRQRVEETEEVLRSGGSILDASIATGLTEFVVGIIAARIGGHIPRTIPRRSRPRRRSAIQIAALRARFDALRPVTKGGLA